MNIMNYVLLLLHVLWSLRTAAQETQTTSNISFDLPDTLIAFNYTITIVTRLQENDFSFNGDVIIDISCLKPTNKIVLHAKDLQIGQDKVQITRTTSSGQETNMAITSHGYENTNDFYAIWTNDQLVVDGHYRVYISYTAVINETLFGYYRASYTDRETGQIKWMATTHLEPTGARQCFPCMDVPSMKATFLISLGHAPDFKAISNMPIENSYKFLTEYEEIWIMDVFYETVSMSTYLVAMVVAKYDYVLVNTDDDGKTIGVWIRKELLDQLDLAKKTAMNALPFYEKYLGLRYMLPKLDLVSVPQQQRNGIEHYGVITMSEFSITYDPSSSNVMDEYRTAMTICHEIFHQWVGNYVTMRLWNDLWLNEGFASYFEDFCVGQVEDDFFCPKFN